MTILQKISKIEAKWLFLPFLILYSFIIFMKSQDDFKKDEWRYVYYAENLLQGEYSPAGTVFLWSGPGYPIVIAPFIAAGVPFLWIKLLNGLFLYFSVILLFKSLLFYLSKQNALIGAAFWGIYWPAYEMLSFLMTEPFAIFLITLIAFDSLSIFKKQQTSTKAIFRIGFSLAFLAITKFIFGYVLAVGLLFFCTIYLIKRQKKYRTASLIYLLGLMFCLPYLIYTFQLTGRTFYWGNAGGMQLYWMSSPYEEEKGDWINFTFNPSQFEDVNDLFRSRHEHIYQKAMGDVPFLAGISTQKLIQVSNLIQDDEFKQLAIENIKNNPLKYLENWVANISRMLFNTPFSYKMQSIGFIKYLLFSGFVLLLMIFASIVTLFRWKLIRFEIYFLLLFLLVYLGGSSLISAYPRQFYIVVPLILIWAGQAFNQFKKMPLGTT